MLETVSLMPEFQRSAFDMRKAFRTRLDNLVILVDSSRAEPVYASPDMAERLSGNTHAIQEALDYAFPDNRPTGGCADYNYTMAGISVSLIALREKLLGIFSPRYTKEMLGTFIFDHEMGHLVAENGFSGDDHLAECVADAYAALRHIQRFGRDTDFFEYCSHAHCIVLGLSPIHYTDSVIQRVKLLSEETKGIKGKDIANLSLEETAELAGKIAVQCSMKPGTRNKVSQAFAPLIKACQQAIGDPGDVAKKLYHEGDEAWPLFFRGAIDVMKDNRDDPDIFETGKRFLSHPARIKFMQGLAGTDDYWQKALNLIGQPVVLKEGAEAKRSQGMLLA